MLKSGIRRDLLLSGLFFISFVLTLKASSDALPTWLQGTRAGLWFLQFSTGNQNLHDISVGILVSLFIYLLIVWLPEHDKRRRVRRNLELQYDSFKAGCILVFLSAMKQGYDSALIEELKKRQHFKRFFEESFSSDQSRWDAVANGLDAESVRSLIVEFEILIDEVRFTLSVIDVENQEIFGFLKKLSNTLYRAKNCSPEYESIKSLLRLMWSVFTGWSFTEGYSKKDDIANIIKAI